MKVISFDSKVCQNLEEALQRQWVQTNCFGGFCASTIPSINTSRYHGLLVARLKPPLGHYEFLNSLEETLYLADVAYPLSSQLYADSVYPEGYKNLFEFSLTPFPTWTFRVDDLVIAKTLIFMHDEQTVLIRYRILEGDEHLVRLEVKPLTAFREINGLQRRNNRLSTKVETYPGRIRLAGLTFHHDAAIVDRSGSWYCRIRYPEERLRGHDFEEDLYAPFRLVYTFQKSRQVFLCASLEDRQAINPTVLIDREEERRFGLLKKIHVADPRFQTLAYSAPSFFANPLEKADRLLLATHFPSSGEDSVRDALIALHGLTLTTGHYDVARGVLTYLAGEVREGLLPKHLFRPGRHALTRVSDYSAMDLPLWFIHCAFEYLRYSRDTETVEKILFPVLNTIVAWYVKGTHFDIHVDSDGLVSASSKGKPLTWMDVKARNSVMNAREGKPVEIQALWYNGLSAMALMSGSFGHQKLSKEYEERAQKAKDAFNRLFWDGSLGYLYDAVHGGMKDRSLRPNQLLALGLPFPILEEEAEKWRSILETMKRHLLTPYGLRTLAPYESHYRPHCEGDAFARSQAHHQGSAWTWLFAPFLRASLRLGSMTADEQSQFLRWLSPLVDHVERRGLGFISEFFDGESPQEPRGSIASALSTGPALELYEILDACRTTDKNLHMLTSS